MRDKSIIPIIGMSGFPVFADVGHDDGIQTIFTFVKIGYSLNDLGGTDHVQVLLEHIVSMAAQALHQPKFLA